MTAIIANYKPYCHRLLLSVIAISIFCAAEGNQISALAADSDALLQISQNSNITGDFSFSAPEKSTLYGNHIAANTNTNKNTNVTDCSDLQEQINKLSAIIDNQRILLDKYASDWQDAKLKIEALQYQKLEGWDVNTRASWGAAAVDRTTGIIYTLQNQVSQEIADNNVVSICKGRGGKKCDLLGSRANACFAVARIGSKRARPDNFLETWAESWQEANDLALQNCQNRYKTECTIRINACSPDSLSKPEE